jgi:peroxiredoxin
MLEPGSSLPAFSLQGDRGEKVTTADFAGRFTVLWWYVKADTPG